MRFLLVVHNISAMICLASAHNCTSHHGQNDSNRAVFISNLFDDYDRDVIPATVDGKPLQVDVQITFQSINEINQEKAYFEADVLFTQIWTDSHLRFSHIDPCRVNLSLPYNNVDKIWFPNVCFVNSKRSRTHISPDPNIRLLIFPNGTCYINYRVRVRGPCTMNLETFPMDSQTCQLIFESYSYNSAEVRINWVKRNPIRFMGDFLNWKAADFKVTSHSHYKDQLPYSAGMWDQLVVNVYVKRMIGYYIVQAYMPTFVCLMMCWTAFFLDTSQMPARMTLSVSTLMVLTFIFGNISDGSPRVSYMRAIDMWVFACMLFTFFSMVELAFASFVDVFYSKKRKTLTSPKIISFLELQTLMEHKDTSGNDVALKEQVRNSTMGFRIDMMAIKIIPATFLIFCLFYWWHFYFGTKDISNQVTAI